MLTRQNILVAILTAPLLILWINLQINPETTATVFTPQDSEQPDFYMKGVRSIATGKDGTHLYKLTAETTDHFPLRAQTEMNGVVLTYFRESDSPWLMTALQAILADDRKQPLIIKGNVHLEMLQKSLSLPVNIYTDTMSIWPDQQRADSQTPTLVTRGGSIIATEALNGNLLDGHFDLERRVKVTYIR